MVKGLLWCYDQCGIMPLKFNLINSHAVTLGKVYKETLIKRGGSDITEIGADGIARRVFNPWLTDVTPSDRERIAHVIISAIETGKPLKAVAKELKTISAMSGHDTDRIAYQETKYLLTAGTMARLKSEHIQQGVWNTLDPGEKEHVDLNGKVFDLDDPIWNMLYQDGCRCYCSPVLRI